MARLHVEAEATAKASPETVWALVSDVTRYPSWGPWSDGHYEKAGEESPRGVGAVQVLRSAQRFMGRHTTSVEKILEFEEDRRLAYTVIRGIPVRNYRADISLEPDGSGTRIDWAGTYDEKWRGTAGPVGAMLSRTMQKFATGVARYADARHGQR